MISEIINRTEGVLNHQVKFDSWHSRKFNQMKQLDFFNTIGLTGETLVDANVKAETQEQRIYKILVAYGSHATPYEVWAMYERRYGSAPKVSIGRALTNGTKKGIFKKVNVMKQGVYGKPNYQWEAIINNETK